MALRVKEEWEEFFIASNIPAATARTYAATFVQNRITEDVLPELTKETLHDLGIDVIGDILAIIKQGKQRLSQNQPSLVIPPTQPSLELQNFAKAPAAQLPHVSAEMTLPQFRKFRMDWNVFKHITNITGHQINAQLYSSCDANVQNSIVNTVSNFFNLSEEDLLNTIENIVTKRSNPSVHRLTFSSTVQSPHETIQEYIVKLKSLAPDCEFTCPGCNYDLQSVNIRDQFIRGLCNEILQTDILAKADHLKELEAVVKHAQAFESAQRDQTQLQSNAEVMAARTSHYQRQKKTIHKDKPPHQSCQGCGSSQHGQQGAKDRSTQCPAWGKVCSHCNNRNHFASVCRKKNDTVNALIAHVKYESDTDSYTTTSINTVEEISVSITPLLPQREVSPVTIKIFPDSGASICLAGLHHLHQLNLTTKDLIPCTKKVTAVGGSTLTCKGWLPMVFNINNYSTKQPVYFCDKVTRIYFSRKGCVALNILSKSFPFPMPVNDSHYVEEVNESSESKIPVRPKKIPFSPTADNVPKLEQYIRSSFAKSAFSKSTPFPSMSAPPAHIHLKPNSIPYAKHTPIPVPFHWKQEVKELLDNHVKNGILQEVPIGTPVQWCSTMVVTAKKDGRPRITVDLQHLNSQCLRETHHTPSPFQTACQVPPNTKKSVLDAVDGFHAIKLDEESQPLTAFITEWGRYMYLRLPQGFLASSDAYTRRYDELIKGIPRKVKIVDDTLLYDSDIESAFFHVWDYLTLCAENGIVINESKFQFCKDTVDFAGLKLTPSGVSPTDHMLNAIQNFPQPTDITGARSWFGLVNQVAWAYSISPIMQPFRELVKTNSKFMWNETLTQIFENSKLILINKIKEGIQSFDISRNTCLQTDWSKEGIGYLLLQQYCDCPTSQAPTCCQEGWKLVFAGSRFTNDSESRYSPTEGEMLAIAWSLEHSRLFILGCKDLIISTDHKPLLGILNNRDISSIVNPRISNLKQKTLRYQFTPQYNPGKWNRGADVCSRNPVNQPLIPLIYIKPNSCDIAISEKLEESAASTLQKTINNIHENEKISAINVEPTNIITFEMIQHACHSGA